MSTYISLAVSATMFPEQCTIETKSLTPDDISVILANDGNVVSALNPSHATTIDAIRRRYGIDLPIPERAPKVALQPGDSLVILQAQLPRLAEGEKHSDETVNSAKISFLCWNVS
jgi:hypothetical protein